jgi:serine/threonine protein kinase
MSTLISQGGYGCVFYPGVDCQGKMIDDDSIATKVQVKNFTSNNEINIGKMVRNQGGYELFFLPVLTSCDINIRKSSIGEISKCKIIDNHKNKYVAMSMKYLKNRNFVDIVKYADSRMVIQTFIESYKYLLMAIEKLTYINVIHFDLKLENIIFHGYTYEPRIIDFGISVPVGDLNASNMKHYFYTYAPSYYVWCIDIIIINFLLHETDTELTDANAETISRMYVANNKALSIFSSEEVNQYLDVCIKHIKTYVGRPREEVIQELMKYSNTWDNYSLSIIYLKLIDGLFPNRENNNTFIILMIRILFTNIHPDPSKRLTINDTMIQFSNIFYIEGDVDSYILLARQLNNVRSLMISTTEVEEHSLKKQKTKLLSLATSRSFSARSRIG